MITNGYLKDLSGQLEVLTEKSSVLLYKFCSNRNVPLSHDSWSTTVIDWIKFEHYENEFDFEGADEIISQKLLNSDLNRCSHLIVDIGFDDPVFKLETGLFIKNWYSFFAASGYMNVVAFSPDNGLVMEFSDRDFVLRSNFKVL